MLHAEFDMNGRVIGNGLQPYIIAEAGSNFNQSMDLARRLIDVAAEAGADAVKFQLFRADVLYPAGGEMYEIFKSIELNAEWVPALQNHARQQGIEFLASAFDVESVKTLRQVDVAAFKVASSEATNLQLLYLMASFGKPMIISTAMCDMVDVEEAVAVCQAAGNNRIALLQCGAVYPLSPEQVNLRVMQTFVKRFGCPVGFSDHTLSNHVALASVGLGAALIEKHFTLDKTAEGPDHGYAAEPHQLRALVSEIREACQAMGSREKEMLPQERAVGRREGLYAARTISAGSVLSEGDIEVRRPALGIRSRHKPVVLGARSLREIQPGEPLTWQLIGFS